MITPVEISYTLVPLADTWERITDTLKTEKIFITWEKNTYDIVTNAIYIKIQKY
jgi:hypothetical protein